MKRVKRELDRWPIGGRVRRLQHGRMEGVTVGATVEGPYPDLPPTVKVEVEWDDGTRGTYYSALLEPIKAAE